jgi:TonB family protein
MRIPILIALAVAMSLATVALRAQSGGTHADSASISTTPTDAQIDDPAFAAFLRVTPGIKPPQALRAPDPQFPEDLPADADDRGLVVMLIGISTKGHVEAVHVLRSDQPAFERAAVETVKKWRFKPAQQSGHAVPVQIEVEMRFRR